MSLTPKDTKEGRATAAAGSSPSMPSAERAWEDRGLPGKARLAAYKEYVRGEVASILASWERAEAIGDEAQLTRIMTDPESQRLVSELEWLKECTAEEFLARMDLEQFPKLLGKNFLGAKAWQAQGIDVGAEPPIPATITMELLESECPLHPGEKIKETHLLVLMPKTVNGKPYTAVELDNLCAARKGSGDKLIYAGEDWANAWKTQPWASTPQEKSEWVLIPKSDPDRAKVPENKHFRAKTIAQQQAVHAAHYSQYREAKTVEVMTAALLNDLTNGAPRMLDGGNFLRCQEASTAGGRIEVGFHADGLWVDVANDDYYGYDNFGRALAWK